MRTPQELAQFYAQHNLTDYFEAANIYGRNAITMDYHPTREEAIPLGASKLGGLPHLPPEISWPRMEVVDLPLGFLCQINLAEVKPFDTEGLLPESGMLYFFYDCSEDGMPWGFDPQDKDGWKVLYYDGPMDALLLAEAPVDLDEVGEPFQPSALTFDTRWELPDPFSAFCEQMELDEETEERLDQLYDECMDEETFAQTNKLLGHSDNIQSSMEDECEMLRAGISAVSPEDYATAHEQGIGERFARWRLLLQLDSNEEIGMMWGDSGKLYFWIPEEELKARKFEDVWMILQCY